MEILQSRIPYDVTPRGLPGIAPMDLATWLIVDEAYGAQVARKVALLRSCEADVLQLQPCALAPAQELLALVVADLAARDGFVVEGNAVRCPDGRVVTLEVARPLHTLAHLVQEDFCILQKQGDEHVMTGALLGFPASWMLAEKFGNPLGAIHDPVAEYDANVARRVQRLFDGVQVGRPLWRFNALWYADAELHQPRSASARRPERGASEAAYFRSERQTVLRLPKTGAVVFGIHTFVLARGDAPVGASGDFETA